MTGRMEKGDGDVSNECGVATVDLDQVRPDSLHELRFCLVDVDFGVSAMEQTFDAVNMVEMAVGDENFRDRQVLFLGHFDDTIHIPGGVDDCDLAGMGVAHEVDMVRHWPQLHLFYVNR